jgi:hypothetical protein
MTSSRRIPAFATCRSPRNQQRPTPPRSMSIEYNILKSIRLNNMKYLAVEQSGICVPSATCRSQGLYGGQVDTSLIDVSRKKRSEDAKSKRKTTTGKAHSENISPTRTLTIRKLPNSDLTKTHLHSSSTLTIAPPPMGAAFSQEPVLAATDWPRLRARQQAYTGDREQRCGVPAREQRPRALCRFRPALESSFRSVDISLELRR